MTDPLTSNPATTGGDAQLSADASGRYVPAAGRAALTGGYDLIMRASMREKTSRARLAEQTLHGLGQGELLDLGCGTGTLSLAIAEQVPSVQVTGLDGDPDALKLARRKDRRGRVTWIEGRATSLPFPNRAFDRVIASLLLHHLRDEDKRRALLEASRVLGPTGRLHVCDWGPPRGLVPRAGFAVLRVIDGRENTRAHARGATATMIAAAGFQTIVLMGRLATPWGTLEFWRAERSCSTR